MDRRFLILIVTAVAAIAGFLPVFLSSNYSVLLGAAFLMGGMTHPLYALLLAYVNDFLEPDDMPAASAGLIFINGIGAIAGPIISGWAMGVVGPSGFWAYMAILLLALLAYGLWRSTQRAAPAIEDTGAFVTMAPAMSPVAVDMAQEVWAEEAEANEADEAG
jgi:MFS family permease